MKAGRSNIEVVARCDTSITIRDVGPWSQYMTITNNAEAVVSDLWRLGLLKTGVRLFYYDSAGELDELLHDDGVFVGFAPGPAGAPYGDVEEREPEALDNHWHPYQDDRDSDQPMEFTEGPEGDEARERWAEHYDDLNGAPEGDWDR